MQKKVEKMWPGQVIVEGTGVGIRMAPEKVASDQKFFEDTLGIIFPLKGR